MKKIYLACPYTHPDPIIQEHRFMRVNQVAASLMSQGFLVFSPISHTHPIAMAGSLPKGWAFWAAYDITFIEWCDEVHVCKFPGYDTSTGVTAEIKLALELGKPVVYIDDEVGDGQI